eukprot:3690227-Ditylum_brightwellii.AAC.1
MEGYKYPICSPQSGNKIIGAYAASLSQEVKLPRLYLQSINNAQFDKASTHQAKKRVIVTTEVEDCGSEEVN